MRGRGSFQFTHPVRGATAIAEEVRALKAVSIHAPREGCDLEELTDQRSSAWFQFTHPVRGATVLSSRAKRGLPCFNSRTP